MEERNTQRTPLSIREVDDTVARVLERQGPIDINQPIIATGTNFDGELFCIQATRGDIKDKVRNLNPQLIGLLQVLGSGASPLAIDCKDILDRITPPKALP